ncbi:TIGR00282 family metallophosphoesterase [Thiohalophilus sp.]|uniref:TIGR00282 family metallophosphoesterase n=1 Tax=Thiohalophilus sp. TaxID=3028392 RepID=UPI003975F811
MHVLFIGDVVGEPGFRAIATYLPHLVSKYDVELVIANAENIADGNGVTRSTANALFEHGVDVLTNGNHAWDKKEALDYIKSEPRLLRPHNYPAGTPGSGWCIFTTKHGHKVGILNLLGNLFMPGDLACPFATALQALEQKPEDVKVIIVDVHAEVASEKIGMGWYLDGKVSAVVGTHTHVPTADERILPKGTGYITDVGMSGCYDSIVGLDTQKMLNRLIDKQPESMSVAEGKATLCAVMLDIDEISGRCREIFRLRVAESDMDSGMDELRLV